MLKAYLEENIALKENVPDIPAAGMAVLHQHFFLVQAIEEWMATLKGIEEIFYLLVGFDKFTPFSYL